MTLQEEKKEGGADPGSMIQDDDSEDECCTTVNSNSHSNSNSNSNSKTILTSSMSDKKSGRGINRKRKYLWLPARSLLVLTGPARYLWSHGIAPRTTDKVKEFLHVVLATHTLPRYCYCYQRESYRLSLQHSCATSSLSVSRVTMLSWVSIYKVEYR
jgi:hypothetical protein